jgi:hypothetical protein
MALTMGLAYLIYEKLTVETGADRLPGHPAPAWAVLRAAGRRWFAKHLTYRVLAETMRAKFYLRLAGADHLADAGAVLSLSGSTSSTASAGSAVS